MLAALLVISACLGIGPAPRVQPADPPARFVNVDVFVDSGSTPLAAYQVEFIAEVAGGKATLVGIEGSGGPKGAEPAPFSEPPAYDPAALAGGRVIIADYSTAPSLPVGRTRVARLHLMVEAPADNAPTYRVELMAAGSNAGLHITATADVTQGDGR